MSRIRLNWQGDNRQNSRVSVPAAVFGASVQKGFSAMNFRMLAAPAWPRGRVFALMAFTALGASFLATDVWAQAPAPAAPAAPKAAPKAAPGAPAAPAAQAAPPAGAPAAAPPADQQVQLIYAPWTKFCLKGQDANAKQVDRKSTRLNSSHLRRSRMPSSA